MIPSPSASANGSPSVGRHPHATRPAGPSPRLRAPALATAVLAVLAGCGDPPAPAADLVLRDVAVVDVTTGEVSASRDLYVDGSRISAILPAGRAAVPEGARVVEGEGRVVIPGLWDAHVHSAGALEWHFPLLLAHGVTSVRNMHTSVDDALHLVDSIARAVADGALAGPRFIANGPILDGSPAIQPGSVEVGSPAEARAAVDSLADGGADFIKVYENLTPELFLAVAGRARERGIAVDGHLPLGVLPEEAAAAGMRTIEHGGALTLGCSTEAEAITAARVAQLEGPPLPFPQSMIAQFDLVGRALQTADPELCRRGAEALARGGVAVTPTLINGRSMLDPLGVMVAADADALLPGGLAEAWRAQASSPGEQQFLGTMGPWVEAGERDLAVLHEAGVTLLAGTDIGNTYLVPGRTLHDELVLFVEHGLTPLEALQTATLNPARVFGMADSLGTVAEGQVADLVLLDADPLADIANVRQVAGVVRNGEWMDRAGLDAAVAAAVGGG